MRKAKVYGIKQSVVDEPVLVRSGEPLRKGGVAVASLSEDNLRQWLEQYTTTQECGNAEAIRTLFADESVYWWGPFYEPRVGVEAVYEHHRKALTRQFFRDYRFDIWAVREQDGIAWFQLRIENRENGRLSDYEGIFQIFLDKENKCKLFKEWYNYT